MEVSFKHAIHEVGTRTYHFWMAAQDPLKKASGTQHLNRKSKEHRVMVARKMKAYHRFIQLGLIAQGVMVALAMTVPDLVCRYFRSWFRTMSKENTPPSERAVNMALRDSFFEFPSDCSASRNLAKFIRK